jgi:pyruvate dehydrogenase E2 component (dihydrolipoamide acetyltransferase)
VPDIGDFDEVAVIEVLVKPGDSVAAEQSLITVESDKASMEIPSSHAGVVQALKVKVGDKVSKGSAIATLQGAGGAAPAPARAAARRAGRRAGRRPAPRPAPRHAEKAVPTAALPAHEPTAPQGALPHASPTIRKLARELGVPLAEVKGSGPKGRITRKTVRPSSRR